MHFEMHITAFRGLLEAALCTKKQEKTNSGGGGMAPLSAEDAVLVRTAKAKLDAIACLPEQERRAPFAVWALEHGYGAFDGGNTEKYQAGL